MQSQKDTKPAAPASEPPGDTRCINAASGAPVSKVRVEGQQTSRGLQRFAPAWRPQLRPALHSRLPSSHHREGHHWEFNRRVCDAFPADATEAASIYSSFKEVSGGAIDCREGRCKAQRSKKGLVSPPCRFLVPCALKGFGKPLKGL